MLSVFAAGLLLAGCSPTPKKTGIEDTFVTHINSAGEKHFQITFQRPLNLPGKARQAKGNGKGMHQGEPGRGEGKGRGRHKKNPDKPKLRGPGREKLVAQLDVRIAETGFCRESYQINEENSDLNAGSLFIRGQCLEPATDEDRARFNSGSRQQQTQPEFDLETLDIGNEPSSANLR